MGRVRRVLGHRWFAFSVALVVAGVGLYLAVRGLPTATRPGE